MTLAALFCGEFVQPMKSRTDVQLRQVADLVPFANNARTHSDEQIAAIMASIKEFGWTNPILIDGENGVVAGHGRLTAATRLGIEEVPTLELDGLTDAQRRAYIIADNRLAENGAGWDSALLGIELSELHFTGFDIELTGFNAADMVSLSGGMNFEPGNADEQGALDQKTPIACPECGHEFTP